MTSKHLEDLIAARHGSAYMRVVSIDIVLYAKRQFHAQSTVIGQFTRLVNTSLRELEQRYPAIGESLDGGIIKNATGDGIRVAFVSPEFPDVTDDFIGLMRRAIDRHNGQVGCQHFEKAKWCNCHSYFLARFATWEGEGLVYRDVNDAYNVVSGSPRAVGETTPDAAQQSPFYLFHLEL